MTKRGFTLIELMIVIAVLVTLMAITFRIMNSVSDTEARTMTITRITFGVNDNIFMLDTSKYPGAIIVRK